MATHLPQNQFNSSSDAYVPVASGTGAVNAPPPPAAPVAIADLDRGYMGHRLTPALGTSVNSEAAAAAASDIMHLEHNAITQAIEVRPHNELEQLLGVAGKPKRPPALPRFAPDRHAIWDAMFNPDAPRLRADDPVWADAAPLFLGKR